MRMGALGSGLIGASLVLLLEAYPTLETRKELDQSREEINERNRALLGLWAAGMKARARPLRRLAVRRPHLYNSVGCRPQHRSRLEQPTNCGSECAPRPAGGHRASTKPVGRGSSSGRRRDLCNTRFRCRRCRDTPTGPLVADQAGAGHVDAEGSTDCSSIRPAPAIRTVPVGVRHPAILLGVIHTIS